MNLHLDTERKNNAVVLEPGRRDWNGVRSYNYKHLFLMMLMELSTLIGLFWVTPPKLAIDTSIAHHLYTMVERNFVGLNPCVRSMYDIPSPHNSQITIHRPYGRHSLRGINLVKRLLHPQVRLLLRFCT